MNRVKLFSGEQIPLEMHKPKIVQKIRLVPPERRMQAMEEAGYNNFLLKNEDVFLDMLTDSGVNAMSDAQQAAMMMADDSYAGSQTFIRLERKCRKSSAPAISSTHQEACEHLLAKVLVRPGSRAHQLPFH